MRGLPLQVLERVQVPGGRVPGLRPGDVDADHADVPEPDRQLGDLHRAGVVPHRGEQRADPDPVTVRGRPRRPLGEPGQHRVHDLVEGQPLLDVQLGREPDLGVDHPVRGEVLGALGGDPLQRGLGLHDGDGVRERLQVALQRAGVGGVPEPGAELRGVRTGQVLVAAFGGEVDDGGRAQPAVEVVVEEHLRCAEEGLGADRGRHDETILTLGGHRPRVPPISGR